MATRLYFTASAPAAVSPTYGSWATTGQAGRYLLNDTKGSSALTDGAAIAMSSFQETLDRQYVSTRMAAGVVFNFQDITCYLQALESNADDNIDSTAILVKIVSEDGSAVVVNGSAEAQQTTLRVFTGTEYALAMTSRAWINPTPYTSSFNYTTVGGERIVVEIGHYVAGGGTTPVATVRWGENGTDIAAAGETASTVNGWIEFSNTITFIGEAGGGSPAPTRLFYRRRR
jgi:hypothetical protein